jgi:trans-aconitate methyltransferase
MNEDADLPEASFELVVAATSFHWVVPVHEGLTRCARLLRPGGWLALWWTVFGDHSRPDPFHEALQPVLADVEPTLADPPIFGNPFATSVHYARDASARPYLTPIYLAQRR